mmetsp:Transcript_50056/g.140357  ORF Transcript_50056/g.140357 Transcript_50056/m.140357 type:complete len:251 (+) Transcript_50056:48-800(+)
MLRTLKSFRGLTKIPLRYESTAVAKLDASLNELPMREAVRYREKNLKWTANDFLKYCNAHANALAEYDYGPGQTVALWLPDCAEKHVALVAAAKLGMNIVDIDVDLTEVNDVRSFLKMANCKAIYFQPVHGNTDYLLQLRKSIPEFFHYDDLTGQIFHSKYFPTMKLFIHTGFDRENGAITFKSLFLPQSDYVQKIAPTLPNDAKVYTHIKKGANGPEASQPMTLSEAMDKHPNFDFAKKLLAKEYFEST